MKSKHRENTAYSAVQEGILQIHPDGSIWRSGQRAENKTTFGYLQIRVMQSGIRTHALAHRLVWRHFHGEIPGDLTVNHKNGNKADNRPENLELATHAEQVHHARQTLRRGRLDQNGIKNAMAKLTPAQVAEIRRRRSDGERLKKIAADFGVSDRTISKIARGERWAFLGQL